MWSLAALRGSIALLAIVLLVGAALGGSSLASATQVARNDADAPQMTIHVALQADGDAQWTVVMRFGLDAENNTRAFDRLASDFRAGETEVVSTTPFRQAAAGATAATGRTMRIRNVSRATHRINTTGRLELGFTWTNFARRAGDRLEVGDAFHTESGPWLPGLTKDQELIVAFPSDYEVLSVSRPLTNGTIRIRGPVTSFDEDQPLPSAVLQRSPSTGAPVTTTTSTPGPPGWSVNPILGLGAVAVLVLLVGYLVVRRRQQISGGPATTEDGHSLEHHTASSANEAAPDPPNDESELLSDEERVVRLLDRNGGRMKQVDIVSETDWSNAKVSQLLSEMDEAGRIEKLRIGRENLISLPDESPNDLE